MTTFQGVMLVFAAALSFVPAIHLASYAGNERFLNLRRFVFLIAFWSMLLLIKQITPQVSLAYHLHLLGYPLVFAIVFYCYKTITAFVGASTPKFFDYAAGAFFLVNLTVALTNTFHLWFLDISLQEASALEDIVFAEAGVFFLVHAFTSYGVLVFALTRFFRNYRRFLAKKPYQKAGALFTIAIVFTIIINVVHVFFLPMNVDPTHLTTVAFSWLLYMVVYRKDLHYALLREGRETLMEEMREMYVCMSETGEIVEASKALLDRFNLENHRHIDSLLEELGQKAILYENIDTVRQKDAKRPYLYVYEKTFTLEKFDIVGRVLLLYDESEFVALINELEYLKNYDVMTNLYNRNYLENLLRKLDAGEAQYGLIVTDLNGLKLINDNFGHHAGDELLKRFASILKEVAAKQKGTKALRMGGDEMLLVVPDTDKRTLEKMVIDLEKRCMHEDIMKRISMAAGHAIRKEGEPFEAVLRRADVNLYMAKDAQTMDYQEALLKRIKKKSDG